MVKQILVFASLAVGLSASAQVAKAPSGKVNAPEMVECVKIPVFEAKLNDGSRPASPKKVDQARTQWKRPAGQFYGTGYCTQDGRMGYIFTPLVLRPYVNYTFENLSTVSGTPSWEIMYLDLNAEEPGYYAANSNEQNATWSYIWGEGPFAPLLSYGSSLPFPSLYNGAELSSELPYLPLVVDKDIESGWSVGGQAVSSHYWAFSSRMPVENAGLVMYRGAPAYDGSENGMWFGTNAIGYNAMATRFEKPDQPYLLNSVYWAYQPTASITEAVPLKCFVFKTANDAADYSFDTEDGQHITSEGVELGDLIAYSEAVIPVQNVQAAAIKAVQFEFKEKNPVTGAETAVSLEIEDDITIVVVGYDVELPNGASVSSAMSMDDFDEGYGNLGFLGWLDIAEDGGMSYRLTAIKDFFSSPTPNTTLGVLADVTYPWLMPYYQQQPNDIQLPNEGETTQEVQGLDYYLYLLGTSETTEYDVSFNGEEECDWLTIADVYDDMEEDENGDEVFTGITGLVFSATPNPNDENRTCKVKISIPAASYEITFRQGSNNAVEIVGVDGDAQYFDLQGRRVANPYKGIYIKKCGNKTTKVLL